MKKHSKAAEGEAITFTNRVTLGKH